MTIQLIILSILIIAGIKEVRVIKKQKKRTETLVVGSSYTVALIFAMLSLFQVKIPNPVEGIKIAFKPVSAIMDAMLK
ncbi:hypothetical protein [Paenibacillus roseipurpureus]|uniref:Uncharacterized protein n=1 Tax=Paenibacillus roseopurpureus TaxID=2918901 RepID=A0AA96LRV6_9BACL|nr:hypothetical protein [Paenibacillus sp. MBLB1832]WNR46094.1 hypothetical protein MJB10_08375 [Paenibacillus sp. MBLB1832]